MLNIQIHKLGKKYQREWIFRNLSYNIEAGQKLVILGGNGSGKSTLLQVISGFINPNQGELTYYLKNQKIKEEALKNQIAFASPYLQLIEDFTLTETIEHISKYKAFQNSLSVKELIHLIDLDHAKNKFIKQFSSGMKQRLKLGLAILSDTPLLLLDEPASNLDQQALAWYKNLIEKYCLSRTVIVCSNAIKEEYFFCDTELNVMNFKSQLDFK